jgi:hypothetical protein
MRLQPLLEQGADFPRQPQHDVVGVQRAGFESRSVPTSRHLQRGRAIPDTALISLLLQVGEVQRAVHLLQTLMEITLEEFEMQPLGRPVWMEGSAP